MDERIKELIDYIKMLQVRLLKRRLLSHLVTEEALTILEIL